MAKTNKTNNSEIKFNVTFGTRGEDAMPANAAVLLREASKRVDGESVKVTEFMAIEGVRRTSGEGVVLPILALMVADAQVRLGFANDFASVTVNGKKIDTKITAKSIFTRWLGGDTIYRTDSTGALKSEYTLDEGLLLRNTSLNVKKTSPLLTAQGDELTALLKTTAKAIGKQVNLRSTILAKAESLYDGAVGDAKAPAQNKSANEKSNEEKAA